MGYYTDRKEALAAAVLNCAEYLDEIIRDDFDGGCDWPNVDGTEWCSRFCEEHGCAKARSQQCHAALSQEA